MTLFAQRIDAFLAEYFALDPVTATAAGDHAHDGQWPDPSDAGRAAHLAFIDRWQAELGAALDDGLTTDERIDRDLLLLELDAQRFALTELREECWDPLSWVYLLGGGIFPLLAREFAPLPVRLDSIASRLEAVPELLGPARRLLVGVNGRPVSRFHAETALKQLSGIADLADDAVHEAEEHASDPGVGEMLPRVRSAAELAKASLESFETHLRDAVLPAAEGEGRLGHALFATKMRHTLKAAHPTIEEIVAIAEREYGAVRAEMVRLGRELWPTWSAGRLMPEDDGAIVRGVLDAVAGEHRGPGELLEFCRAELERIEAFCRERDLIGLADEPLDIRWTPVFLRAFGGAMLDSPGPLDKGQKAFFSITPIPEDWTPEEAESYLREDNDRMLRLLTIHEAVPGHYLQGVYANRCASIPRAVFWSGVFAEGWAVYVTQVMMDAGYGADDPALLLTHWKFYRRAIINAIIDIRIHTAGMSEEDAVAMMVDGGFQEEAEARNKYNRARLSSTQLSTYFVGSMELWEIERARRARLATATGDARGADVMPARDLPGGLGATPGFHYREHLESVIGHGSPPLSLLRRTLLGD